MKATLTIEVPDDFRKGDAHICPYSKRVQHAWGNNDTYDCYAELTFVKKVYPCNKWNCPLEIQEEHDCSNCKNLFTDSCNYCSVGAIDRWEQGEYSTELSKENNQ